MPRRKIVRIDEDLCDGCGLCVPACAEGAIQIVDGKARLVSDNLCDGLGDCLGECPRDAISIEEREAVDFDDGAMEQHLAGRTAGTPSFHLAHDTGIRSIAEGHGCPGSRPMTFTPPAVSGAPSAGGQPSTLRQWPVQLHLLSPTASYFQGADVLLAADCTAFTLGDFHGAHLAGKTLAIACPKLDHGTDSYLAKLVSMIDESRIDTLTVMIMEVPCCGGLVQLAVEAVTHAKRKIPIKKVVVGIRGDILSEDWL